MRKGFHPDTAELAVNGRGRQLSMALHIPAREEIRGVLGKGQVCVFQGCASDLCSTNFDEINPSTEGLSPSIIVWV